MKDLREEFLLDPSIAFLNHGSFGACPRPVFEAYQHWQRELEVEPVDFMVRQAPGLMADARAELAGYLGVGHDDLVFVTNATTGVNTVARSLALGPGDLVLGTDHEYGACDRVWRFLSGKQGFAYQRVPLPVPVTDAVELLERVTSALAQHPKVLMVSQITSPTALVLPVAQMCAAARERGILTLVDGAHAPGQLPLDLAAIGADFYTGNCHKWLCAPKGAGFLYARPEVQHLVEPLVVSWGWESETPGPSRFVDWLEYGGTRDLAAYLSVPAAIAFQADRDWPAVRARCTALLGKARDGLLALPGARPIHHDADVAAPQMAAVQLPPCDPERVHEKLFQHHGVEIPVQWWDERPLIRVSIQAYNAEADVDRLLGALPPLLNL